MTAKHQTHEEVLSPSEFRQRQSDEETLKRQRAQRAKQKAAERRKIPVTGEPEWEDTETEEIVTQRQAPVTKAVNCATSAKTSTPPLLRTIRNGNIGDQPPPNVASNARLLQIWEGSTDEERRTAMLILGLDSKMAATDIEGYFRFGEEWETLYPLQDKSRYECGRETVKKGAILGGTSASRIYQILATLKAYTQTQYRELAAQAEANGVTIRWTHLRVIAWRLGKSEYRTIRRKIEQELVRQPFTESQLNKRIDELAPATVDSRKSLDGLEESTDTTVEGRETGKSGKTMIAAMVTGLGRVVSQYQGWVRALNHWESEYQTNDQEEVDAAFGTVNTLLHQMQETRSFLDQVEGILEQMQNTVGFYAKQADSERRKQTQTERAARINERVAAERAHAKTRPVAGDTRLKLTNEFNDAGNNGKPFTYIRDEQEGNTEGDNDEFGPVVHEEDADWEEGDGDDYDEEYFEDIGEDEEDDLFGESKDLFG